MVSVSDGDWLFDEKGTNSGSIDLRKFCDPISSFEALRKNVTCGKVNRS